jgi:hypothetical protein
MKNAVLAIVLCLTCTAALAVPAEAAVIKNKATGETLKGTLTDQQINGLRVFVLPSGGKKFLNMDEWEIVEADPPPPPKPAARSAQAAVPAAPSAASAEPAKSTVPAEARPPAAPAGAPGYKLTFPQNGFSLAPLGGSVTSDRNLFLTLYLPGSAESSPKVDVQIQKYDGDKFRDYEAQTFKLYGEKYDIITAMLLSDMMEVTFARKENGRIVCVYERAFVSGDVLYIVTATAPEDQWEDVSDKLRACVKSFDPDYRTEPEEKGKFLFTDSHFHVAPLDERPSGTALSRVLTMYLPVSAELKPNVNAFAQRFAGTMTAYLAKYKKDAEELKSKILSAKVEGDTMLVEYTSQFRGLTFHGYQRSILRAGTVYDAVATAPEDQWKDVAEKLKACADSLEIIPIAKPAMPAPKSAGSAEAAK